MIVTRRVSNRTVIRGKPHPIPARPFADLSEASNHASTFATQSVPLVTLFLLPLALWGQSFSGRIVGLVTDSSAAVIPNVAVTVVNEGTGAQRRLITDVVGIYVAAELPVGYYTVRFEAPGLSTVGAAAASKSTWAAKRAPTSCSQRASYGAIHRRQGGRLPFCSGIPALSPKWSTRARCEELPLNGRDFRKLAFLVPGAAPRSPRGSLGSFTVNGQREKSNIFLIDGVDNNDSFRNQPSFNQGGVGGAQATLLPVDALAEFSIQTQGSAEYGRNSGAVVNAVIKSGTNEFHGTLYEFLRNDKLNARNFFETLPGATKGPFKNSNFGGTAGGPIKHDRTFFFAGFEGERGRPSSSLAVTVPGAADIAAARAANAAAGRPENALGAKHPQPLPAGEHSRRQGELCLQPSQHHRQRQFPGEDRSPLQRPVQPERPLRVRRRQPDLPAEFGPGLAAPALPDRRSHPRAIRRTEFLAGPDQPADQRHARELQPLRASLLAAGFRFRPGQHRPDHRSQRRPADHRRRRIREPRRAHQ